MNAQAATVPATNDINEMVKTLKVVKSAKPKAAKTSTKPKRAYTKRGAYAKRGPVPRTARAYMKTLGQEFDKESEAVTALIKLHNESQKPAPAIPDPAQNMPVSAPVKSKTSWWPWFGK
jgi:hypothetical protein